MKNKNGGWEKKKIKLVWSLVQTEHQRGSIQSGKDHKLLKAAKPRAAAWKLATVSLFNSLFLVSWYWRREKREKKRFRVGKVDSHLHYKGCESAREWRDVFPCTPSACRHTPSKLVASVWYVLMSEQKKTCARLLPLKNQVVPPKKKGAPKNPHLVFLCPSQHQNSPTHVLPFFPRPWFHWSELEMRRQQSAKPSNVWFFSKDL